MANIQEAVQKALNRAYFYLRFKPRTKAEVERYLHTKSEKFYHWEPDVIPLALERLEEYGFVDDKKYIESYVATRNAIKPKGKMVITQELMRRGVDKDLIENFFADNPTEEEDLAQKALHNHWNRYKHLDKRKRFEKAASFLMRRGFSFSTAKKVIEKIEE